VTYIQSSDSRDTKNINRTKRNKDVLKQGTPRISEMLEGVPEFYRDGSSVISYIKFNSIVYASKFSPIGSAVQSKFDEPSYESEWVKVGNNESIDFVHNLSLVKLPQLFQLYISDVSNPVIGTDTILATFQTDGDNGAHLEIKNKDELTVHVGDTKLYDNADFGASPPSDITDGYMKIKFWI